MNKIIEEDVVTFFVDGKQLTAAAGLTVIQALSYHKIQVPYFCFNDELSIAGNCRMCLLEIKNSLKPVASCAINISNNMEIFTKTKFVQKAREDVIEFLLINHPLDCPICDQGGECDLQDISFNYGTDRGRFFENKRAVTNKFSGPLIKMIMSRCIHCTRCTRFFDEYVGKPFFGMLNRGFNMEIDTYTYNIIDCEIAGNVADLCPVGALTPKSSAFSGRPWEFEHGISIDMFDTFGAEIRVDHKNDNKIYRILPNVNERNTFISDKIRFIFDLFNNIRFEFPCILSITKDTYLRKDFSYMKYILVNKMNELKYKFFSLGNFIDYNIALYIKTSNKFLKFNIIYDLYTISSNKIIYEKNFLSDSLLFTNVISLISCNELKKVMVVNSNLRFEMPLLNLKLREYSLVDNNWILHFGNFKVINITYKYVHASNIIWNFLLFLIGKFWASNFFIYDRVFSKFDANFKNKNLILIGFTNLFTTNKQDNFINYFNNNINVYLNKISNIININYLNTNPTLLNSKFINLGSKIHYNNFKSINQSLLYGINADIIDYTTFYNKNENCYKVYQGFFLENLSAYLYEKKINLVLPTKNWLEYDGKTLTFDGEFAKFNQVYQKSQFLKRPDFYIVSLLQLYVMHLKLDTTKTNKALVFDINTFFNNFFFNNSIYQFYLIQYKNKKEVFFSNFIGLNKIKKTNQQFSINLLTTMNQFINIYNYYYKMDFLSKISTTLTICSNFIKFEDNF